LKIKPLTAAQAAKRNMCMLLMCTAEQAAKITRGEI